jgi:hypothetical protein
MLLDGRDSRRLKVIPAARMNRKLQIAKRGDFWKSCTTTTGSKQAHRGNMD